MSGTTNLTTNKAEATLTARVTVRSQADLPAPSGGIIPGADNTEYYFLNTVVLDRDVQFKFGINTSLNSASAFYAGITGNTTSPNSLFLTTLAGSPPFGNVIVDNLTLIQGGTGDMMDLDIGNAFCVFRRCPIITGDLRVKSVTGLFVEGCAFVFGATFVVDGSADINDIRVPSCQFLDNAGPKDGILVIEEGASIGNLEFTGCFITLFNASTAIKFEKDITIENLLISTTRFNLSNAASFGIEVENPNDIFGKIDISALLGSGKLFEAAPVISSFFTAPGTNVRAIGQDGDGNLLLGDDTDNLIYRMVGLTSTEESNIATPGAEINSITWFKGDMYTTDIGTDLIYQHVGFTTSTTTIGNQGGSPTSIVFAGTNLVSVEEPSNTVYIHDGFTTTILGSFTSPATDNTGLAFDGVNLLIADSANQLVYVMKGVSATVQYTFSIAPEDIEDITMILDRSTGNVGFAFADEPSNEVQLFDHPVTFDHSSQSWDIQGISGVVLSSDRGGNQFGDETGVEVTVVQDEWTDIADAGVSIFYGCFSEFEKMVMNDEKNGELLWLASRDRGRIITGQVTISRDGGGGGDVFYQIALNLNGIIQKDSITTAVLPSVNAFITMSSLPISRDLIEGSLIKLQIRNITSTQEPNVALSKIAIF